MSGNPSALAKLPKSNYGFDAGGSNHAVQIPRENLAELAENLKQDVPNSLNVLGPIRCTELDQIRYDFYVDQWPAVNLCMAVIRKEHFKNLENQPYSVILFFGRNDDRESITNFINAVINDWHLSLIFLPGPNAKQIAIIADICSAHGTLLYRHQIFHMVFATDQDDIKVVPVPPDYEYVTLTADDTAEAAGNWKHTNAPFKVEDIRTLIKQFLFCGIRHKPTGDLVAQCGQFHNGSCGIGWVHPEHRGKKLFQAVISRLFVEVIARYGFVFGTVIDGNVASAITVLPPEYRKAMLAVGMREKKGYNVHWGQFIPHGMPLPEVNLDHSEP